MKKLYFGGHILTMETERYAQALLTEDDRILCLGKKEDLASLARGAEEIDLHGGTLMPGFIDPHSHFSQVASGMLQASLSGANTPEAMHRRIGSFLREHDVKAGEWVIAKDYDHNVLPGAKHLSIGQLDALCPQNPLVIQHQSGHMGLFNTLALRKLGVTTETPSPEGGKIGQEDGMLTGFMEENAFFFYMRKVPMPSMQQLLSAYKDAQQKYASFGITTMQEGMLVEQMFPLYQALLSSGLLKLDLIAYPDMPSFEKAKAIFPEHWQKSTQHLRLGGIKIFLDGSPQGRTAWMRTPYTGEGNDRGYGTLKDEQVLAAMALAAENRTQLLAHCNGDAAAAQMLRCLEESEEKWPELRELRPVMIHAQLLGLDQLAVAARLGVIVSFFVAHVYHWGDVHIRNFGLQRASAISPAASALERGLLFTFHQDAPVIPSDMLETVGCAVNRITKEGVQLGPQERIPTYEALKAVTINAAYQYFEENRKGSLREGKQADMVVLEQNPLTVSPSEIAKVRVLQTIKDGQAVFSAGL